MWLLMVAHHQTGAHLVQMYGADNMDLPQRAESLMIHT
jgi:hypothetical protein